MQIENFFFKNPMSLYTPSFLLFDGGEDYKVIFLS
jgi:hypothetical protein